jgi:hypothetical protein
VHEDAKKPHEEHNGGDELDRDDFRRCQEILKVKRLAPRPLRRRVKKEFWI